MLEHNCRQLCGERRYSLTKKRCKLAACKVLGNSLKLCFVVARSSFALNARPRIAANAH